MIYSAKTQWIVHIQQEYILLFRPFNQFHHIIYTLWICFFVFRRVLQYILTATFSLQWSELRVGCEKLHLWSS